MKTRFILIFTLCFTLLAGWGQVSAAGNTPGLEVEHSVDGKSIDFYFTVKNFDLSQDKGWVLLTLDGRPIKVFDSQKRVSGLSSGTHKVIAVLEQKNGTHPGMMIEFEVNIP